ncbi:MAG: enolase, partial [Candidatus Thermoplasmatota archaeon]|nr:enolase [Candidatus Thermoplasmatota archaeon]
MQDFSIKDVRVRKVLDSRGNFTIEAEVVLGGAVGIASAPAGASTGATEVVAFSAKGIDSSIDFFKSQVKKAVIGFNARNQVELDKL